MKYDVCLVVPCYNEEKRLPRESFASFLAARSDIHALFVDDGSADATSRVAQAICAALPGNADVIRLPANAGKGNAVQAGMVHALTHIDAKSYGFWDCDLSTPLELLDDFLGVLTSDSRIEMVTGCRLKRLGVDVRRSLPRHYVGRVFATFASMCLDLPVYDTQCGAKLFSKGMARTVFATPFLSRWIFDVEIFFRAKARHGGGVSTAVYELPLRVWHGKAGSKVNLGSYAASALDLVKLYFHYKFLYKAARA
jgi:glycosyltransferase involved in cell wall biosynthesis